MITASNHRCLFCKLPNELIIQILKELKTARSLAVISCACPKAEPLVHGLYEELMPGVTCSLSFDIPSEEYVPKEFEDILLHARTDHENGLSTVSLRARHDRICANRSTPSPDKRYLHFLVLLDEMKQTVKLVTASAEQRALAPEQEVLKLREELAQKDQQLAELNNRVRILEDQLIDYAKRDRKRREDLFENNSIGARKPFKLDSNWAAARTATRNRSNYSIFGTQFWTEAETSCSKNQVLPTVLLNCQCHLSMS